MVSSIYLHTQELASVPLHDKLQGSIFRNYG